MKKLLTLILTLVMTVFLANLNYNHTKADDNSPSRIENLSWLLNNPGYQTVTKIVFTKNTEMPIGGYDVTSIFRNNCISNNAYAFLDDYDVPQTVYLCCADGFVDKPSTGKNFAELGHITTIDFGDAYRLADEDNLDLKEMFKGSSVLTELDLTCFDTSKVINMKEMFNGCTNLSKIKVSNNFKTDLVTESMDMFAGSTNLPNFDANYVDKEKAIDVSLGGYLNNVDMPKPTPTPSPSKKDESCEKVIGPTWHWNNDKGICEEYSTVGTSTR